MKRIPLTQGKFAIVDNRFYRRLMAMGPWTYDKSNHAHKCQNRTTIQMHRVVWQLAGRKLPRLLDHRDTDGLNNRLKNLRPATHSQNTHHRGPSCRNSSGYKGVHYHRKRTKWVARIMFLGVRKYLGSFDTAEEAARVYDKAAARLLGEFAFLNFATAA